MTRQPKPGHLLSATPPHPTLDRPAVWVTVNGARYAGREHGRGQGGTAVYVEYHAGTGRQYHAWVQAAQVEPREDEDHA